MDILFDPALVCPCCHEISANDFLHDLNHRVMPSGDCISTRLRKAQKEYEKED